jgi:hypothetical protein
MHHPLAAAFWFGVIVFMITLILTKKPHALGLKVATAIVFVFLGVWSIYGMAHINMRVAIGFAATLAVVLAWRTIRGWGPWWENL